MLVDILDLPADRGQEVPKHSRQESDSVNEATKHIRQETVQIELKPSQKWIVLGLFVINSLLNAWGAQTISASPNQSMQLFPGLTESGINTILLYSAVLPFLGMMPCAALLVSKEGVHRCIQVGSILVAVGLCLRSFPAFLSTETRIEHSTTCLSLLHVGQFLNAAAFPFFMASPSSLSKRWFPPLMRTTITGESSVAAEIGFACSYLTASFGNSETSLGYVLQIGSLLSLFFCALTIFLLNRMPFAPSFKTTGSKHKRRTADLSIHEMLPDLGRHAFVTEYLLMLRELRTAFKSRRFVVCAMAVGLAGGCFTGWAPLIPQFTHPPLDEEKTHSLGLSVDFAAILGSLIIGQLADKCFHQEYRLISLGLIFCSGVSIAFVTFLLPSTFNPDKSIANPWGVWLGLITIGLSSGALLPISYEWCADLSRPVSEGTSGAIYQILVSAAQMLVLLISLFLKLYHLMFVCGLLLVLCFVAVLMSPPPGASDAIPNPTIPKPIVLEMI